jgi:predicted transcriptional regulator
VGDKLPHLHLSRRESQVMDVLYRRGSGSVADVVAELSDQPGYNTIRNTLAILERKGYVQHREEGRRYIYAPNGAADDAQESALRHVVQTFFQGSLPRAVVALLGGSERKLTQSDLAEIERAIESARREARAP